MVRGNFWGIFTNLPFFSILPDFMKIKIVNGPNLNLLGRRQHEIYGSQPFEAYFQQLVASFPDVELTYFQSNHEGAIIDCLQEMLDGYDGLILNPAAYGHTSIAIADTLAMLVIPIVEVHISNIYEREAFRHRTYTSSFALESIIGKGIAGYKIALDMLLKKMESVD